MKTVRIFFLTFLYLPFLASAQKPNVLFITVDDMNGWGIKKEYPLAKTPYLDKLAAQSVNFTKAVCASPVCTPSRAAFFSGMYPHKTGAYYNGGQHYGEQSTLKNIELLPELFKRNGYETFGRGKIFHEEVGKEREEAMFNNRPIYKGGFGPFGKEETWVGPGNFQSVQAWEGPDSDFPDVLNADATIQFLNQDHKKPFFCYLGLWRPHTPYTAPKRFFELHSEKNIVPSPAYLKGDLLDVPPMGRDLVDSLWRFGGRKNLDSAHVVLKRMMYGYLATTSFADWSVGRVMEALDGSAHAQNTIVVFSSDNGYHTGDKERWQKGTLWEKSAYTPLMIRLPNGIVLDCPETVNLLDIYPTLVELCKLDPPKHYLDGISLVPLLKGEKQKREPSLMTYGINYSSITDGRFRFIRYPDGSEELYDHSTDPHEWNNLKGKKKIRKKLEKYIPKEWAESLGGVTEKQKGA